MLKHTNLSQACVVFIISVCISEFEINRCWTVTSKFLNCFNNCQKLTKESTTVTAILNLSGQVERRVTSLLFFLVLVYIEELIRALETKFHQLSKHLACLQKNSFVQRIFNSSLNIKTNCVTDNYRCSLFRLHEIHLCTCSYRIPGCCYTQH